ncbi:hypothetical protein ACFX2F_025775 [Malus domestica]
MVTRSQRGSQMLKVQGNMEEEITFFKENFAESDLNEVMEISSPTKEEENREIEMEDTDILQGGGGRPGTATGQP